MSLEFKKQDIDTSKNTALKSKIEKIKEQIRCLVSQNVGTRQEMFVQTKISETDKLIQELLFEKLKSTRNTQLKLIYDRFVAEQNPDFLEITRLYAQINSDGKDIQRLTLELKNQAQVLDEQINYQKSLREASLLLAKDNHGSCVTIGWGIHGKFLSESAIRHTHVAGRADLYNSHVEEGLRSNAVVRHWEIERLTVQKNELHVAKKLQITQLELRIASHAEQLKRLSDAFSQKYSQAQLDVLLRTQGFDLNTAASVARVLDQYMSLEESNETLLELGKFETANISRIIASIPKNKVNNMESILKVMQEESGKRPVQETSATAAIPLKPDQNHLKKKGEDLVKIEEDAAEVEFQDYRATDRSGKNFLC